MALPLFLKIDVTNDDIVNAYFAKRRGLRSWAQCCPISTAITRQLGTTDVSTNQSGVMVNGEAYESSPAVIDYIRKVDATIDASTNGIPAQTFYLKHAQFISGSIRHV